MQKQKKLAEYEVTRIINNNIIVSIDEGGNEIVLMGKGISFGKRKGDYIKSEVIEKQFILQGKQKSRYIDIIENISPEYLETSVEILDKAREQFDLNVNSIGYISLADHIGSSIDRFKEGITLKNEMLNELKNFYPNEFLFSLNAVKRINAQYNVLLSEDEAGFITFHIVNIRMNTGKKTQNGYLSITKKVVRVVESYFEIVIDHDSIHYERFLTHMKYFYSRVFRNNRDSHELDTDNFVIKMMKIQYPDEVKCVDIIAEYLTYNYNIIISEEEKGYLLIHIINLKKKAKK